jgi:hypothetical protein
MANWSSPPSPDRMSGWVVPTASRALHSPDTFIPVFTLDNSPESVKRIRALRVRFTWLRRSLEVYAEHPLSRLIASQSLSLESLTRPHSPGWYSFGLIARRPELDIGIQSISRVVGEASLPEHHAGD